ncbi:MAG: tetratricopeptide repeat protein [Sedimentisphaerales bacterium]|nr:tetratricopeptide repeat protein [Sedimentisphaerales bacterium]
MDSKKRKKKDISSQTGRPVRIRKKDMMEVEVEEKPSNAVTGWKLWLFRILAITIIPAFLFILLEGGLRLTGFGYPTSLALRYKDKNIDSYYSNLKFSWLFFNPGVARAIDPFMFPLKKSDETYRIFVMGASAAAGTPDGAYSFGRMLQVMLRLQYPGTNFEVFTAAMPAINSHVVLRIAKDCAGYDPDLYVVYLGNNEVVGPYGAGTVFAPLSDNLSLIRFGITLKSLRVGQLLTNLTGMMGSESPKVWGGMEMFLNKQVRKNDPQMAVVYRNYQRNLTDICHVAQKNKIPLICCTVGSNLKDSPPFASQHSLALTDSDKEQWDQLYQQGVSLEIDGQYSSAADIYLKAAQIDADYADLQFRLGRCYWEMGQFEESKDRFILAREQDTLRFRADNQINKIILEVAGNKSGEGIYLVDACKMFEENSPHGTSGQELFYEHVHLKFNGNYLLAQTIFKQVQEILPEQIKNNAATANVTGNTNFPSEQEVARYLAYTDWEKYSIVKKVLEDYLKHPPFTNQLYQEDRIKQEEQKIKVLKAVLTEDVQKEVERENVWAIKQTPSDVWLYWKYGLMLENHDNVAGAALQYEMIIKLEPTHHDAYAKLGLLYGFMGQTDKAIEYNLKALKLYPYYAVVYYNMGVAYHLKQMYDKAIDNYEKAISLNPRQADVYYNYALLLYDQGKVKEALDILYSGLKYAPDNLDLHYGLAIMLNSQGRRDEAVKELREALKIDPNHADARKTLDSILEYEKSTRTGFGGWN